MIRVGSDRVEKRGDSLTVITALPHIPGWDVRRYRAPVIRFEGRTWRVTKRTTGRDGLTRYELVAWSPLDGEITGPELEYSSDVVALRDQAATIGHRRGRVTVVLNIIRPLTGFLPARTKATLETKYGIDPVAATRLSLLIEFVVTLGSLAVASIGQMVQIYGYQSGIPVIWFLGAAAAAAIDGAVRWSRVLDEERPAPGFYEWLFRRRLNR